MFFSQVQDCRTEEIATCEPKEKLECSVRPLQECFSVTRRDCKLRPKAVSKVKCKAEQKRICVPVLETKCENTSEQVCLQVRYITWNYDMKDIDNELIKDIDNDLIKDIDNDLIKSVIRCHRPPATPAPPWLVAQLRRMSVEFLIPKSAPLSKLRSATRLRRRPTWGPSRSSVYLGLIDVFLA